MVLAFQEFDDEDVFLLYGADAPDSEHATVVNISNLLHLDAGDWRSLGLAVTSGRLSESDDEADSNVDEDQAGLYMLIEGRDDVLAAECSLQVGNDDEIDTNCYWITGTFTGKYLLLTQTAH